MGNWLSLLEGNHKEWLLERGNPSVRYFTLRDILDRPESDPEVMEAKREIIEKGAVPEILSKQNEGGYWDKPQMFYTSKYKGTVWQLIILAELGVDGKDERIKGGCEFILEKSQDRQSGGFSIKESPKQGGGLHSYTIPCLTGNMVWSLIKFGYLEDPRVQKGIGYIVQYQRFDDGIEEPPRGWPYERFEVCFGRHTCFMGAIKALKALSEIPPEKRTKVVTETIEKGVGFFLIHHIFKESHNLKRVSKPGWRKLGFPLMYQTDILEILGILTKLGIRDERMNEALEILISKKDEQGRWKLENTFNSRFQVDIEEKGKPSKWITLNALRVLKSMLPDCTLAR